eukprot:TRINITY_DN6545_c0_g1_i1.p1 TRINITY_DN6545_c0_g1~~TRINITY_DN6545_c0_g1_i1.p1  ORF type:complete len:1539 (+),score=427.20 TRINITY_DN6545_c0_g1_i1:94-4710(+)
MQASAKALVCLHGPSITERRVLLQAGKWKASELALELEVFPLEVLDVLPASVDQSLCQEGADNFQESRRLAQESLQDKPTLERSACKKEPDQEPEACAEAEQLESLRDRTFLLVAGVCYKLVFRAMPLLDFDGTRPIIREQAAQLLSTLPAPIRVVAFVGPGRCGKSFTLSRLAEDDWAAPDASCDHASVSRPEHDFDSGRKLATKTAACERFPVAHGADPLTVGVDFCVLPNTLSKEGGVLLLMDCEGSDNPSDDNAARCSAVVSFAVSAASQLVQCDSTTIKESTLEDLAATLQSVHSDSLNREEVQLCLLVIACRFCGLDDSYLESRILSDKASQSGRNEMRRMIRTAFPNRRIRSLPHLAEAATYQTAVRQLRRELFDCTPPVKADGGQLMDGAAFCKMLQAIAEELARPRVPESRLAGDVPEALQQALLKVEEQFQTALQDLLAVHYVSAKLLEAFRPGGRQYQEALDSFDCLDAPARGKEAERQQHRRRLEERLEVLYHRAAEKNEACKAEDLKQAEALTARLVEEFLASLPDRGRCWEERELESWGAARIAELEAVFVRNVARPAALAQGGSEDGSSTSSRALCAEVVTEGCKLLRLQCWDVWQSRTKANSNLRQALEAAAERARQGALEACRPSMPKVQNYIPPDELLRLFEPVRRSALQTLEMKLDQEELLSGNAEASTFEAHLREHTAGSLAVALQRLFDELTEASEACRQQEVDKANELSLECIEELMHALPSTPLLAPLGEAQLSELDCVVAAAQAQLESRLESSQLKCTDALETARAKLAQAAAGALERVRSESLRKAKAEVQLQQGREAAFALFEESIQAHRQQGCSALPFQEESAWSEHGIFGKAFAAAEAKLAATFGDTFGGWNAEDPWQQNVRDRQAATLKEALGERLESLKEENAALKRAEDARAAKAADAACCDLAGALPELPLRRVLTGQSLVKLEESAKCCYTNLEREGVASLCPTSWHVAKERVGEKLQRMVDDVRTSNEILKVQREESLRRALERQQEEFARLCADLLNQDRLGEGQVTAAATKMNFLLQNFEDEARHVIGDGVLVVRGEWEEELLRTMKTQLTSQLDASLQKLKSEAQRSRFGQFRKLSLVIAPLLLALLLPLVLGRVTKSNDVAPNPTRERAAVATYGHRSVHRDGNESDSPRMGRRFADNDSQNISVLQSIDVDHPNQNSEHKGVEERTESSNVNIILETSGANTGSIGEASGNPNPLDSDSTVTQNKSDAPNSSSDPGNSSTLWQSKGDNFNKDPARDTPKNRAAFRHPQTQTPTEVSAPLPADLVDLAEAAPETATAELAASTATTAAPEHETAVKAASAAVALGSGREAVAVPAMSAAGLAASSPVAATAVGQEAATEIAAAAAEAAAAAAAAAKDSAGEAAARPKITAGGLAASAAAAAAASSAPAAAALAEQEAAAEAATVALNSAREAAAAPKSAAAELTASAAAEEAAAAAAEAAAAAAAAAAGFASKATIEEDASCADVNELCADWASAGACAANNAFMLKQCRRSCGFCGNSR